jgi:hypothetical protein
MLNIEMNKSYKVLDDKVIYLNSEVNCTKITNGATKNIEFIWNIPSITIDEFAKLRVFNFQHKANSVADHDDRVLSFRLKNVLYNQSTYFNSDNTSYPLLFAGTFLNESSYWNADLSGITIIPQTINTISIVVSDSMTDANNGIPVGFSFIIGMNIQQYDLKLSEINNPYK